MSDPDDTAMENLAIGQVQWHSSDEDGFPDVGVLLRLSEQEYLWAGELINADGPEPCGLVIYTDKEKKLVLPCEFETARELVEDHIAPAIRALSTPAPADASGWRGPGSSIELHQWRGMLADAILTALHEYDDFMKDDDYDYHRALDKVITHLERVRDVAKEVPSPTPPDSRPIDMGEIERALEALARLEIPKKPQGNAGAYSIFHSDILRARQALAAIKGEGA